MNIELQGLICLPTDFRISVLYLSICCPLVHANFIPLFLDRLLYIGTTVSGNGIRRHHTYTIC